jgi:hypothetical protein
MASKYIQKFPIPKGFPEILHDLSKEILRHQPDDIIEFAALYFKSIQDGVVLDYKKIGKNIPCDFEKNNPKTGKKKDTATNAKRTVSKQDEIDHVKAVEKSKMINDPAKVMEDYNSKPKVEPIHVTNNSNSSNNNITSHQFQKNVEVQNEKHQEQNGHIYSEEKLIKLSSSFVSDLIDKKLEEHQGKVEFFI